MTKSEAKQRFIQSSRPFNDYYELQQAWVYFTDMLCRDKQITLKQFESWGNPCSQASFQRFNNYIKIEAYNKIA